MKEYCFFWNNDIIFTHLNERILLFSGIILIRFSFKQLQSNCAASFTAQWKCLDENNQMYERCRSTQSELDQCVFDKMVSMRVYHLLTVDSFLYRSILLVFFLSYANMARV